MTLSDIVDLSGMLGSADIFVAVSSAHGSDDSGDGDGDVDASFNA
jgi:hypothetical protein